MRTMSGMFRGRIAYKGDEVQWRADRISADGRDFERLFPSVSNDAPSESSPQIWSEWSRFLRRLADMTAAASELMKAASQRSAARTAFAALGQTCRSCRDNYRLEKK